MRRPRLRMMTTRITRLSGSPKSPSRRIALGTSQTSRYAFGYGKRATGALPSPRIEPGVCGLESSATFIVVSAASNLV